MIKHKIKVREVFSYYLPQFHEIKQNNQWWGKGFTEWDLLKKSKKHFTNHELTSVGELGYYSLDDVTVIEKQYQLAKKNSVSTFAFWHYWFDDDDMLLNKPAENILKSNIDVKFCFAWANHTWYNKTKGLMLKEQKYDYSIENHFKYLLPFFLDSRYTKIDNKPTFFIYNPNDAENCSEVIRIFNKLAIENGFSGIFFIAENSSIVEKNKYNFDAFLNSCNFMRDRRLFNKVIDRFKMKFNKFYPLFVRKYDYNIRMRKFIDKVDTENQEIPVAFPRWDSTIRHGKRGVVLTNATPYNFEIHLQHCISKLKNVPESERFLMIKSWNEWGEGNYIEPCERYGSQYLNIINSNIDIL